jgi:Haem-containing dehydratase
VPPDQRLRGCHEGALASPENLMRRPDLLLVADPAFLVSLLHFVIAYRARVPVPYYSARRQPERRRYGACLLGWHARPHSEIADQRHGPDGAPSILRDGDRVRVKPYDNVCLIRSGQNWSDTEAGERKMYLDDVEPVLRAGIDFLRDEGRSIDCFTNRYMTMLDRAGRPTEKSYGMSWWKGLAALERWSESHPTHVRIFGAAMKYLSSLGPAAKLRLYHEVTVARAADQFFEYRNCHDSTGMLNVVTA